MDSEPNNHIIISGISSKSREDTPEQGSPSVEQGESSEGADPPAPAYQLAVADHDREYGCRYCHKKFSNKQALGGHQNAHKVERAMEKESGGINYYDDDPNPYPARMNAPAPFLASYHRHPDFLHRTSLFSWRGGSGRVVTYNPRPSPGAEYPYGPCSASVPLARPHYTLPGNVRLPNFGPGSSGAFGPLRNQGPPGFSGFVVRPRCSNPAAINLRNVPGNQHDEFGLDLSLKLG